MACKRVLDLVCLVVLALSAGAPAGGLRAAAAQDVSAPSPVSIVGRCHCGAVAYRARGPVVRCGPCDCRDCQRASGSLKPTYVTVARAGFKVTSGKPAAYRAKTGEKCDCHGTWHFCRKCGGPLYWENDNGKEIDLFAGSLDDPSIYKPSE